LNKENLFKMGLLFAALHEHGANFQPPPDFTTRKMDSIYARGEIDALFNPESEDAFTPQTREILTETDKTVKAAFARLYSDPHGLQIIHNDLHHDNIKIYRGQLCPFDFEDTIWGYPVQDIAMAMQDLMTDVAPDTFNLLQDAFRSGYESQRAWPAKPGEIDTFRAGRMIWVSNYVARYQRQYLRRHLDWLSPHLARFLTTGRLSLSG
jgi:Ser/Thr protein kinase RdoA (MazF antagonist)